jgi:hypothetical protein
MRKLSFVLAGMICAVFICGEASAKVRVQNISEGKASSLCKGHGGGTDCSYCHDNHCHEVSCDGKRLGGSCTNTVTSNIRGKPGQIRSPITGVKTGNAGTTGNPKPVRTGIHRPVDIGTGVKPVFNGNDHGGGAAIGKRH